MTAQTRGAYPHRVPHGIMFHHFHGGRHPRGQGSITGEEFERVLRFVGVDRILTPSKWLEKAESDRLEPGDVCITMDDALLCQIDIALPIMEKLELKAFWFVYSCVFEGQPGWFEVYRVFRTTQFPSVDDYYDAFFSKLDAMGYAKRARAVLDRNEIEQWIRRFPFYSERDVQYRFVRDRALTVVEYSDIMNDLIKDRGLSVAQLSRDLWMTNEHLRRLSSSGHAIGLHSYSHPMALKNLPEEEQAREYRLNYAHIEATCGHGPRAVAHPCGSYGEATLDILYSLGIIAGFCSSMTHPRLGRTPALNRLEQPREDHTNICTMIASQGDWNESQQS